jgi:hypothetical protein
MCLVCACTPGAFPYGMPAGDNVTPHIPVPPVSPSGQQPSQDEAVALAKQQLASQLKIDIGDITVVSVESVNWPDTSLGLPQPDKAYAQVVVPGFKITLRAQGTDYVYHAGLIGQQWLVISEKSPIISENNNTTLKPGTPTVPQPQPQQSQDAAVAVAKQMLASQLKIDIGDIIVVSVESVNWPDTSLGLPQPDKVYAQVLVPGFKITLKAQGTDYVFHAGLMGQQWLVISEVSSKGYIR